MVLQRYDYNSLLDNLKYAYDHYVMNKEGEVFNKNGEKIEDNRTIANVRFSILYCLAYRTIDGMVNNRSIDNIDSNFVNYALTDVNAFNSFINNCLNEYKIYTDIGTGHTLYFPYSNIANYILKSSSRKKVLIDYLKYENESIINIQQNIEERSKVYKMTK